VEAWQRAGVTPTHIKVTEPDDQAFAKLAERCPWIERASLEQVAAADIVLLALHPPAFGSLMPALRASLVPHAVVVSLAPKLTLAALKAGLGKVSIVRMIPNAPSIIGRGFNPVVYDPAVTQATRETLAPLFGAWGACPEVPEAELEAYAVIAAMGPTYFWYQWQALRDAAQSFGLSPARADESLRQMLDGALATMLDSGLSPEAVMDLVPVRPLQGIEADVKAAYERELPAVFARIHPPA
jgi:pyrroline-5-carboxylate reductase